MSNSYYKSPSFLYIMKQAITSLINTAALEETALSNMLNLEKDILQRAKTNSINLEEFTAVNESVNHIIRNIIKVQLMTQIKLQFLDDLLQKVSNIEQNDTPEE